MFPQSIPFDASPLMTYADEREIWLRFAVGAMSVLADSEVDCNEVNAYASDFIGDVADAMLEQYRRRYPMRQHETR